MKRKTLPPPEQRTFADWKEQQERALDAGWQELYRTGQATRADRKASDEKRAAMMKPLYDWADSIDWPDNPAPQRRYALGCIIDKPRR